MDVKVVDFKSDSFQNDLIESIKNTGFVVLTNHGIPESLIRESQAEWRSFFKEDKLLKNLFVNDKDGNMGYKGMRSETAVGAKKADLKEFYHWKPGYNLPGGVSTNTQRLYSMLNSISADLLKAIDADNRKDGTYSDYAGHCQDNNPLLRTLYYPAMDFGSDPEAVRAAAHEDINYITLLVAASSPGLQVMDKQGKWHDVPFAENSIVVNIGDMLQLISGGKYKSTTHRVVNSKDGTDRISMPLFVHPAKHIQLSPEKTAGQFLEERIAAIYGNKINQ